MMLPNRERAYVDRAKIADYLLSRVHPDGRGKAEFFMRRGFHAERWSELAEALQAIAISHSVVSSVQSLYGVRYAIDGSLVCPDGRRPNVRTVWILEHNQDSPRLVRRIRFR